MPRITLKAARVNAGLTQVSAANALNVSNKTLCKWEKGVTFPKPEKIDAICELYKVSYDNILFFKQ